MSLSYATKKKNAPSLDHARDKIRRVLFSSLHKVFLLFSCVLRTCKIMKNAQILLVKPYPNLIRDQIAGRSDTLVQYLLYFLRLKNPNVPICRIGIFSLHKVFLLFPRVLRTCEIMKNAQILLVKPYPNLIGDQIAGRSDTLVQYLLYFLRLKNPNVPICRIGIFSLHKVFLLFPRVLRTCEIMKNAQILLAIFELPLNEQSSVVIC